MDTAPFSAFEWMLAGRYLRARRKEGFISVIAGFSFLGIMLGVATLIIVMAVMNGFRAELFDKILGLNGHVVVHKVGGNFTDYDDIADRINKVRGVTHSMPLIEGQVMVSGPGQSAGALVRGMRGRDIEKLALVSGNIQAGSLNGFDEGRSIAIGSRMATALGVTVGQSLTMINPRGKTTIMGTTPNIKRYKISAVFEIGMSEYDRTIVFMPFDEAQRYFNKRGLANVLEIMVDDPEKVGDYAPDIRAAGGSTIFVSDWRKRNESFFSVLEVERNVMFLILSLIVLVAALNIISGLMMLVKDKGRDIAILRTMGASQGSVMRIFLITGASIGIVGTLAGFALGVLVCVNIDHIRGFIAMLTGTELFSAEVYYLRTMPAEMDIRETATVVMMALGLSVLATIYPSWRASKMDPVDALRYE